MTHPWPAVRVWELENWRTTAHFRALRTGDIALAHSERSRVSSFFSGDSGGVSDPVEALLREFTGEFGKGVGEFVAKGKSFFGDVLAKARAEGGQSKDTQ